MREWIGKALRCLLLRLAATHRCAQEQRCISSGKNSALRPGRLGPAKLGPKKEEEALIGYFWGLALICVGAKVASETQGTALHGNAGVMHVTEFVAQTQSGNTIVSSLVRAGNLLPEDAAATSMCSNSSKSGVEKNQPQICSLCGWYCRGNPTGVRQHTAHRRRTGFLPHL